MCTVIYDKEAGLLLRTLDLEIFYGEYACIMPRKFPLKFLYEENSSFHPAVIGTAHVVDGIPLWYEGANELGLSVAGLNFPSNAVYFDKKEGKRNLASYELIPYLLSKCSSVYEARELLGDVNITNDSFSEKLMPTPLHWFVAGRDGQLVVEQTADGLQLYDNPLAVMTNNPPFSYHLSNVINYRSLSSDTGECTLTDTKTLPPHSNGLGAFGLPGDFSSSSRLVRGVFMQNHTTRVKKTGNLLVDKENDVVRAFHILDTVSVPLGASTSFDGEAIFTVYSSVIDTRELCLYFTTYGTRQIRGIRAKDTDLDNDAIFVFAMKDGEKIRYKSPAPFSE